MPSWRESSVIGWKRVRHRLSSRLTLLAGGARDQPARLRSMRDAIAWSHDLLPPTERVLFRQLAVFAGGFTLDAAEAVTEVAPDRGDDILVGILNGVVCALLAWNYLRREPATDAGEDVAVEAAPQTRA